MSTVQQTRPDAEIDYPETDGRPMAETPLHRDVLFLCIDILRRWFAANQNVYVSGNMMLYYERGNPRRWISPDVQVTLGIPREPERRVYKTWVEGKMADLVIEATSRSTQREDEQFKFELYRGLGVAEYYLFDPEGDYLDPPLVGYRLIAGEYRPIEPVGGRLPSDVLRLHLQADGATLRFFDPAAGRWLQSTQEHLASAQAEVERLRREVAALKQSTPPQTPQ
ncbi:MAG TPA: Uma2 family endonuclease [Gemmataceae bacterium]|nr:Uma2 family endonuclease [Gemmataceae bacterium]